MKSNKSALTLSLSPRRGDTSKAVWVVIVAFAMAGACFGQGTISFSSSRGIAPLLVPRFGIWQQPAGDSGQVAGDSSVAGDRMQGTGDGLTVPGFIPIVSPVPPVPPPSTEPITIRVWDNSGGPIQSWDVRMDPSAINGMLPQAPPMPWLHQNSGLVSFSELLLQLGMSPQESFVGPVAVPEPGSLALICLGAALAVGVLRRKKRD